MVRFIIDEASIQSVYYTIFTFQYGQIYYYHKRDMKAETTAIYIPIWLDLLYRIPKEMFRKTLIYIPIWLDLL